MAIRRHMFVLAVPDVERSAAFYRDALGFEVREIGDAGWRMFERDGCRILAGECPDAQPAASLGDHAYFGYLVVDDVDAEHRRAVGAGAEVLKPPTDEPWGLRECALRTVDGHRLVLGQPMADAAQDGRKSTGQDTTIGSTSLAPKSN